MRRNFEQVRSVMDLVGCLGKVRHHPGAWARVVFINLIASLESRNVLATKDFFDLNNRVYIGW